MEKKKSIITLLYNTIVENVSLNKKRKNPSVSVSAIGPYWPRQILVNAGTL
jgi:hypothetical protein